MKPSFRACVLLLSIAAPVACDSDVDTTASTTSTGGAGTGASGTGASGTGASGTGASGTGGVGQGGATGTGGTGSTGGAGTGGAGPTAAPECTQDSDCVLNNDCCECAGRPVGETPPSCPQLCIQSKCQELGIADAPAVCRAGRCVAPGSCDESKVLCAVPSPICAAGEAPVISGACYTGSCQKVLECEAVTDCGVCTGAPKPACVQETAQLATTHCVDVAAPCSDASCACLGPSVCVGAFDLCVEATDHLSCECPTCLTP
jgi:hypothetical protein